MRAQISKDELDAVKGAIVDAEAGRASMGSLARAREICGRAGAQRTLAVIEEHMRRLRSTGFTRMVLAGLVSGSIVALTVGRWAR